MKFIQLTRYDNIKLYIRPEDIQRFQQLNFHSAKSKIILKNGDSIDIKETTDDLIRILNISLL